MKVEYGYSLALTSPNLSARARALVKHRIGHRSDLRQIPAVEPPRCPPWGRFATVTSRRLSVLS